MTHLAMPEQWRFNGTDLSTYAVLVTKVDGVDEAAPLRGNNLLIPSIAGRRFAGKQPDEKRLTLALWVQALNAAGTRVEPTDPRQVRANIDALYGLFSSRALGTLVRVMTDATERHAAAEVVSIGNIDDDNGGAALGVMVDFLLPDPAFYGGATSSTTPTPASPTNFNVTNAGSLPTHRLLLTFNGPIANPRLLNLTIDPTGQFYVEALVTVLVTKQLVIDCEAFTAANDGVNAIGSLRHSGAFEFFRLAPGVNSLRVTATTPGGSVVIAYSPPYL